MKAAEMESLSRSEVVVVGVAAMDMVALVKKLPQPDELVLAHQFRLFHGGAGANVAAALPRLGCRVTLLARVGNDEYGRQLTQSLKDVNVNTAFMDVDETLPTPTCFITVDARGERTIVALGKAAILAKADDLNLDVIRQAKAIYLSDVKGDVVRVAAYEAHQHGATVFYGPGSVVVADGMVQVAPLLHRIDVLLLSKREAKMLMPETSPEKAARTLLQAGATIVVLTLGAKGALVATNDAVALVPAPAAPAVVDTTGAGDAFAAGLLTAHIKGKNWLSAAKIGCIVASIKIGHHGARSGIPSWADVTMLMKTREKNHASS